MKIKIWQNCYRIRKDTYEKDCAARFFCYVRLDQTKSEYPPDLESSWIKRGSQIPLYEALHLDIRSRGIPERSGRCQHTLPERPTVS